MKLTDAEIDEIATQPCSATGRRKKELAIEVKELREALKAAKAAGAYEAGLAGGGAIAEIVATNTNLRLEVERLKASRLRWRSVAYDKNAALVAALAANTPLKESLRIATEAHRKEGDRAAAAQDRLDRIAEALTDCGYTDEQARVAAIAILEEPTPPEPAVTGTTSDKAPICKPETCTCSGSETGADHAEWCAYAATRGAGDTFP